MSDVTSPGVVVENEKPKRVFVRYSATDQQVVDVWRANTSAKTAAQQLQMSRTALAARIRVLRKAGVVLDKKTPGGGKRRTIDVEGLNKTLQTQNS